mmetsp:Transcript_2939/g.8798  ORF Transcript_2939/g.8798 Transcript_2939/m.8798 type:complete len:213 (+) Transcript_2939:125-763(+)
MKLREELADPRQGRGQGALAHAGGGRGVEAAAAGLRLEQRGRIKEAQNLKEAKGIHPLLVGGHKHMQELAPRDLKDRQGVQEVDQRHLPRGSVQHLPARRQEPAAADIQEAFVPVAARRAHVQHLPQAVRREDPRPLSRQLDLQGVTKLRGEADAAAPQQLLELLRLQELVEGREHARQVRERHLARPLVDLRPQLQRPLPGGLGPLGRRLL